MRLLELAPWATIALNVAAWLIVHLGVSYAMTRVPDDWLAKRIRPAPPDAAAIARSAAVYERVLRIKAWKDRLPDGGSLFAGGFPKKKLLSRDAAYIGKFAIETVRGEYTHWLCMLPAPLFFLWNTSAAGWIMIAYAATVNVPFILIQRYNRQRLHRLGRRRGNLESRMNHVHD